MSLLYYLQNNKRILMVQKSSGISNEFEQVKNQNIKNNRT